MCSSMSSFQGNHWQVNLPPNWQGNHHEDCSTIFNPNGVGALQISSYSKGDSITESDLEDLAKDHLNTGAKVGKANAGEFDGFTFAYGTNGEFWQFWFVAKGKNALLITYNCNEDDLGPEREQAKMIVSGLKAN